jgi:thimet oligopeptidase
MEHSDVTTFLHEFGHLIHFLYSGHQDYEAQAMGKLQWDFIEAPSQMLEEWTWDYDTLRRFATNADGQPIPEDLVKKMNEGRHFGEAGGWKKQIAYAAISLNYHDRPADFDLTELWKQDYNRYSLTPYVEGTHPYASFGHLNGYSAIYYTYVWSKAIALDLFTRFKSAGIRDPKTAMAYRTRVLDPGASVDAGDLIKDFLGRDMSTEALKGELSAR